MSDFAVVVAWLSTMLFAVLIPPPIDLAIEQERHVAQMALQSDAPSPDWRETQWSAYLADSVGGEAEHRLPDGSRIDILTDTHAWEVEWSDNWPEAIGQAAYYSMATDSKPGVWLLLRGKHDEDYLRCLMVCRRYGIALRVEDGL